MTEIIKICKIHGELTLNQIIKRNDSKSVRCKSCVYNGRKSIRNERIKKIQKNPEDIILICKKHGHLTAYSLSPQGECRQCSTDKSIKWQKNNPEKVKKYREKTLSNPDFIIRNRK